MLSAVQRGTFIGVVCQKEISLQEQRFGSHQAAAIGKHISPDLVCFGCWLLEFLQL